MSRRLLRAVVPVTTVAVVLAGAGVSSASTGDTEVVPAHNASIVLNDGRVIGFDDTVEFTFQADPSDVAGNDSDVSNPGGMHTMRCPETNDPPTYTVTGKPYFLADKSHPQSTWLLPRQTVSWAVTGSHTFTWEIGGGVEAEAGAIIAKAKVRVDTKISNSWTWTGSQTVTDTNTTSKAYRAVLGQVGWRLTGVKTWFVPPCNVKRKTITVNAPKKGDMSIGRQAS
jgi:hypothetical protein